MYVYTLTVCFFETEVGKRDATSILPPLLPADELLLHTQTTQTQTHSQTHAHTHDRIAQIPCLPGGGVILLVYLASCV